MYETPRGRFNRGGGVGEPRSISMRIAALLETFTLCRQCDASARCCDTREAVYVVEVVRLESVRFGL